MIIEFIVNSLISVLKTVFSPLPNVPATPSAIVSGATWVTTTISGVVSLLRYVYGDALFTAIIVVVVALLNFEWIYHSLMWVVRKIPMVNIK